MASPADPVADDLQKLADAIEALPAAFRAGRRDGPVAKYLTPKLSGNEDDPEPEYPTGPDGIYATFNKPWERVFQVRAGQEPSERLQLVSRGKYGLSLAHAWAKHYAGIASEDEKVLIQLRIQQLVTLVESALKEDGEGKAKGGKNVAKGSKRKRVATDSDNGSDLMEIDEPAEMSDPKTAKKKAKSHDKVPATPTERQHRFKKGEKEAREKAARKKQRESSQSSESSSESGGEDDEDEGPARLSAKAKWALSQFKKPRATDKTVKGTTEKAAIWKANCRHCNKFRTTTRTPGLNDFDKETLKLGVASNFISHAENCRNRPEDQSFERYKAEMERATQGLPPLPASESLTPLERQQAAMGQFVQRGIENPAKTITNRSYRQHLVEAIVEDDLSFCVAEGGGTLRLLNHIVPRHITPSLSHQTVRRDIDILHREVDKKLTRILQTNGSKFSIASDIVTTKNMVHSFCGTVVFFIDDEWKLRDYPLDLIPLDADHTGHGVSKLIYKKLKRRSIAGRLMARCAAHVTNLIAQKITSSLGLTPAAEEVDLYEQNRKFPLVYTPETDPLVAEDTALMKAEAKSEGKKGANKTAAVSNESGSGSDIEIDAPDQYSDTSNSGDSDSETDDEWADVDEASDDGLTTKKTTKTATKGGKRKSKKKVWTPVTKVHAVCVHILRSPQRRKIARKLIRRKVPKKDRHLVFMRGMPIRWNTTLAELNRAFTLQLGFDAFVDKLADGLQGKARTAALAKKRNWEMSGDDWTFVKKLIAALGVLELVTLEFSKKNVPTISKVLPLYKLMETKLTAMATEYESAPHGMANALRAGAQIATKYIEKALIGDYALLGAVLHPAIRLAHFQSNVWDATIAVRAKQLLVNIAKEYATSSSSGQPDAATSDSTSTTTSSASKPVGVFAMAMALNRGSTNSSSTSSTKRVDGTYEIDLYLGNISPVDDGFDDPLTWWKNIAGTLKILSQAARDILAIPGMSVPSSKATFLHALRRFLSCHILTSSFGIILELILMRRSCCAVTHEASGRDEIPATKQTQKRQQQNFEPRLNSPSTPNVPTYLL
ncbi:Reverse transcriptase-RNase H-integrase [Mycena indigotica]|uniref:Reverse transcriptase-RNase H-integrase n=1 Tax=Mycena indigotica TaxID=2126181 RepID=A0A8H6SD51_9AGAR|nr:Reverse transcriptase-RNase H-integrase [Mycena indigotica]KAF7296753.1 Reverse transcriptase-RNase H-integrase [Mycena indigotica]